MSQQDLGRSGSSRLLSPSSLGSRDNLAMSTDDISPVMKIFNWRGPSRRIPPVDDAGTRPDTTAATLPKMPYEIELRMIETGFVLSVSPQATEEQLVEVLRALRLSKMTPPTGTQPKHLDPGKQMM